MSNSLVFLECVRLMRFADLIGDGFVIGNHLMDKVQFVWVNQEDEAEVRD